MDKYKVFVVNISDERWKKYDESDDMYYRFKGVDGSKLDLEAYDDKYIFYYNKNEASKKSTIGCAESHMSMMKYIYENQLNNVIVIEDDALLDFTRLYELDDVKGFCYCGGRIQATVLKNDKELQKNINKDMFLKEKLNFIDTESFIITGCHGMYFENYEVAKEIYDDISAQKRVRAIDCELKRIQKKRPKLIHQFIFPAISILYLPDAQNGFTYNSKSVYKLNDNNYKY